MKNAFLCVAMLMLVGVPAVSHAGVSASIDRNQTDLGEPVQLLIESDGGADGRPDLTPLSTDFDVLSTSTGSSVQIVNGHISSSHELRLTLSPKHAGRLVIPPLSWGNEQTAPLTLTVNAGSGGNANHDGQDDASHPAHVFMTVTPNQTHPYVQGAVVLTVQLHTDRPLTQASLDFSGNDEVSVQQLGKDVPDTEVRDGRHYNLVTRQYLLVPQKSGEIQLDGPTLDAQVVQPRAPDPFGDDSLFGRAFSGLANSTRPLRLHGDVIKLDVHPRPPTTTGKDWLPARQVTVEQSWHPDQGSIQSGEPIQLHLRLTAQGLAAAQLPDMAGLLNLPDGVKAYPDQPKLDTSVVDGEVLASKEQDIALIASKPGHYRIPPLKLSWWDTGRDEQREISLPERTLDVVPGAASPTQDITTPPPNVPSGEPATASSTPPPVAGQDRAPRASVWTWACLLLFLLCLAGVVIVGWMRRSGRLATQPRSQPDSGAETLNEEQARERFHQACHANDAAAARAALLMWARAEWEEEAPTGLHALAVKLRAEPVSLLLRELDRVCYVGGSWDGGALAAALSRLPRNAADTNRKRLLVDLYDPPRPK